MVCWRKSVDNSHVYEKVFRSLPVPLDYIARFSFVVESVSMVLAGFKASIIQSFAKDASSPFMAKGIRCSIDAHGCVVVFCVTSISQAKTTLPFDWGHVDAQSSAGCGEPFEDGHIPIFVQ